MSVLSKAWVIIEKPFVYCGTICSILSLVVLCFFNGLASWIAMGAFVISLIVILVALLRVINKFLEDDVNGDHRHISSFINYKTDDGDNVEVETYKLIQVKCAIMQKFDVGFKWSGRCCPQCDSDLQTVELVNNSQDLNSYDSALLRLKTPALYNQTTLIHFRAKVNDAEHLSETKIEVRVEYPIEYIQIVVSLGYKNNNRPAILSKKPIRSDIPAAYKTIDSVAFDVLHKQYVYRLINPAPGNFYKLAWER